MVAAGDQLDAPRAGTGVSAMVGKDEDASVISARLREAAERGEALELIVVLRGKVRPARGKDPGRWHLRVRGQPVFTFPAESVVAATPIYRGAGRAPR
ncbi:MAG: hypothetical protein E6J70_05640 [Deltaproteobacteria bacterium]|nr:MAG: hypothetical protein E6J83_12590 [Deltaproteobacteria bacterium]TMB03291.1 MAG: hypothetical protein E6J70_05640 [Deltaproteobacteria bacterium]